MKYLTRIPQRSEYIEGQIREYCGVQRSGKSTLMVADLGYELLDLGHHGFKWKFKPEDVWLNYWVSFEGVHCLDNESMVEVLLQARREKWEGKVFGFDEASQPPLPFYARNYKEKTQIELVTAMWQMPKRGNVVQYACNIGNSVDVQMRDATKLTIMPKYKKGVDRDHDSIMWSAIDNHECWVAEGVMTSPAFVQGFFDSGRSVD